MVSFKTGKRSSLRHVMLIMHYIAAQSMQYKKFFAAP